MFKKQSYSSGILNSLSKLLLPGSEAGIPRQRLGYFFGRKQHAAVGDARLNSVVEVGQGVGQHSDK